ncbi:MAG: HIT domain-containing protein [Candidatus Saccharimonadales bacterium]
MKLKHVRITHLPSVAKKIMIRTIKLPPVQLDFSTFTVGGPSDRTMRTEHAYRKYRRSNTFKSCVFCDPGEMKTAKAFGHFLITPTKFKYEIWDDHLVDQHLLLIPKRHVKQIDDFTDDEKSDYIRLLSRYEAQGYSFYSRAPSDVARSVAHFHTHLIKLQGHAIRSMLYVNKPHIMLYQKRKK